ncbi:MAG: hypothetical protein RI922_1035 [Bacteroidota bacterium]
MLGGVLFLSTSCTVYYTTSEIDANFNTSIKSANDNCNRLLGQITAFEAEYQNLNCGSSASPFIEASQSMNEIDKAKNQIQLLLSDVSKLYINFKTFTNGKDKIASHTNEWEQFKRTKKGLKLKFKELEKIANLTVQDAEKLNDFVNEKIVPVVKKIEVSSYCQNFEEIQQSFLVSQKDLDSKITLIEKDLQALKVKMGRLYKDKYDLLEKDLTDIKEQRDELKAVYANIVYTIDSFKKQMKGKTIVYSCSSEWTIVNETEKSFVQQQQKFNNIQTALLESYAHMQAVFQEIK